MKILLIGSYDNNRQESMQRFESLLLTELAEAGHEVKLVKPPSLLGRLHSSDSGAGKWIGYIDRYLLYPLLLRQQIRWADVVHLCEQTSAIYIPYLSGKPYVITCHDMLGVRVALGEIPRVSASLTGRIYQRWILRNLRKATITVCVSHQTEKEFRRITGASKNHVYVIANSLNFPYKPMDSYSAFKVVAPFGISNSTPFFLHIGGNQWYKNREGVLLIYSELIKRKNFRSHRLAIAGKPLSTDFRNLAVRLGLEGRIFELVTPSNEQLCALYSTAEALLFPSLQEGFGWPIIEAQACGCPVITTDRQPMSDVSGNAAIFIDPFSPSKAAETISNALAESDQWCIKGQQNAIRFSKKSMIDGYLRCYRNSRELAASKALAN